VELEILKKKLNSYRTAKGRLTKVPDELAYEILLSWEQWTGPASGFYTAIGADFRKVAGILGRAKKLKREGVFVESSFKEIKVEGSIASSSAPGGDDIVLRWDKRRSIRFKQVDQLVEFLKKSEELKSAS